jgi:hypothetical protein
VAVDVVLQIHPLLVIHDHVNRAVGAEEVDHIDDVGVFDGGECARLLQKQFAAVNELILIGLVERPDGHAIFATAGELAWHILLDHHLFARVGNVGQVDDAESATTQLAVDDKVIDTATFRQFVVNRIVHRLGRP